MFKVGDKVRIREWDDMAEEFGLDICGNIPCRWDFVSSMRSLCGYEFTVYEIIDEGMIKASAEESINAPTPRIGGLNSWLISEDMLDRVVETEDEYDTEELSAFIGSLIGE